LRTELLSILLGLESAPEAPRPVGGKLRLLSREIVREPSRRDEQSTVLEARPPGELLEGIDVVDHLALPGKRISTATGNTCADCLNW
jgi:hypothetical protein